MLSGELVGVQGTSPVIGVYLNDGSAAKISYYLRTDVVATSTKCRPDGKTVQLKPGERIVIDYDIATGSGQPGSPILHVTPVALGTNVVTGPSRCP